MSFSPKDNHKEQEELFGRLCNEDLDPAGLERLGRLLAGDVEAQQQYVQYLDLQVALRMSARSLDDDDFTRLEAQAALDALPVTAAGDALEVEHANRDAPMAAVDWSSVGFEQLRRYVRPVLWGTMAAGLIVALALGALEHPADVPPPKSAAKNSASELAQIPGPANLRGTVGARWAGKRLELPEGEGFAAGQRLELVEGLAEIVFGSGAKMVVQGPAIVEIRDQNCADVSLGRISIVVPKSVEGFSVRTAVADLAGDAAEFGAEVDVDGSVVTQVYDGTIELRFSGGAEPKASLQLASGQGARVDAKSGRAALISEPSDLNFVRYLPNRQTLINLAEIVAGGDGFGKAYHRGIGLEDGQAVDDYGAPVSGDGKYISTRGVDFVDGVFIPDGKRGPVQIDSIGRSFANFPPTSNDCWGGAIMARRPQKEDSLPLIRLEFHGDNYGYVNWLHIASKPDEFSPRGYGLIGMHSNCGITFDLHAIRARYPDKKIMRFRSLVGNLESRAESKAESHTAEAWVLVDGKLRHHRSAFSRESGAEMIDLPLADGDRFLVLAVTDGGGDTAYDWVAFGDSLIEMSNLEVITSGNEAQPQGSESDRVEHGADGKARCVAGSIDEEAVRAARLATIASVQQDL